MVQEKAYLDALSNVVSFSFNTTRLTLLSQQGDKLQRLTFEAAE
jgi:hypothetical protein